MGIKEAFMRILHHPSKDEALSIASNRNEAIQQRFQSLQSLQIAPPTEQIPEEKLPSIELQKDSIQLGIAAGYTGRTLREIESSLSRMESQVTTKEWFLSQCEDKTPELIHLFKIHEENEQKRFEAMQNILIALTKTAEKTPEPIRTELFQHINNIEQQLPLTPKMNEVLQISRETKEISYDDLALRLNIEVSALRGLLSNMLKRTNKLSRFEKDRKGWIRYKENQ
jgi:DNA-binding CsgD family transcriptional regulator